MGRAVRHLGAAGGALRVQRHPSPQGTSQGQGRRQPETPVRAQVRRGSSAGPSLRQVMLMDPKKNQY